MKNFIGRKHELKVLSGLLDKQTSSFAVIYGRRRVGKSRLIEEYARLFKHCYSFTGLHPRLGLTNQEQLDEFAKQFTRNFNSDKPSYKDWGDAFADLADKTQKNRVLIVLDEITWLGSEDEDFLGKLKIAWDQYFKNNPKLILIVCGSVSAWINKNILSSTGFYGRISVQLRLEELPIELGSQFWGDASAQLSAYEKLKILAVTGGVPKYLEEVRTHLSANENIRQMCFWPTGLLYNDFTQIFTDVLQKKSDIYIKIVKLLASGSLTQKQIVEKLNLSSGGKSLTDYLKELILAGFISFHKNWNLKTRKSSNTGKYRLSDNYLRFYIKYIAPNSDKIAASNFLEKNISSLPGWNTVMALQVENLILNNRRQLINIIGIPHDEIMCDGPYFQKATVKQLGCQVDYLIQTELNNLYICEIKFTRNVIRSEVIDDVKNKIKAISRPKGVAIQPILICAGDVHDDIYDAGFFAKIIHLESLLG